MSTTTVMIIGLIVVGLIALGVFVYQRSQSAGEGADAPGASTLFDGLSGERLWLAMSGGSREPPPADALERYRQRYEFVLRAHIRELFEEGLYDARAGAPGAIHNELQISTLRGSVMSWIPMNHAEAIYQAGYKCFSANAETLEALKDSLDRAGTSLFRATGLDSQGSLSAELIPRFRTAADRGAASATDETKQTPEAAPAAAPENSPAPSESGNDKAG